MITAQAIYNGLQATGLGMGVVFSALIILFIVISWQSKVLNFLSAERKKSKQKEDVSPSSKLIARPRLLAEVNPFNCTRNEITCPVFGFITDIYIKEGQVIKEGDPVIAFEAMQRKSEIASPRDGTVISIQVKKNESVQTGDLLFTMD